MLAGNGFRLTAHSNTVAGGSLDRVRRLLADTDLPIAEIVAASGFSSPDALSRAVQRAEGTMPLKLRHK